MNYKLKNGNLVHSLTTNTNRINEVLNNRSTVYKYHSRHTYVTWNIPVKSKTVTSKLIHTMHYTEIQPSAFELAAKQMTDSMLSGINKTILKDLGV